jgi:S1-C subfamily serine protease
MALVCALAASGAGTTAHALEANEVFKLADPSIVVVVASNQRAARELFGSGVLVADKEIVTSCHVVKEATKIILAQGAVLRGAELLFQDQARDLCRLRVDEPFPAGKPISALVASKDLEAGQSVFAIGAPRGLEHTITRGIVSGLRELPGETGRLIQTDAAVSPGSSGGGLFDSTGRLVGIISFQFKDAQNLNFATPAEWIAELAQRQEKATQDSKQTSPSTVPAPAGPSAPTSASLVKVGDRWVYRLSDRGRTLRNVTVQIAEVNGTRVREHITVQGFNAFVAEREVDATFNPLRFQPPAVLPGAYQLAEMAPYFPPGTQLTQGQKWKQLPGDFSVQPLGMKSLLSDVRVVKQERVNVPAGQFDAWKVESASTPVNYNGNLVTMKCTFWYAPAMVRTVKMVLVRDSNYGPGQGVDTYELLSYEPGK